MSSEEFHEWSLVWNLSNSHNDFIAKQYRNLPGGIEVIAWDLVGSSWWEGIYTAYLENGRVGYEYARTTNSRNNNVWLSYLATEPFAREVGRYVDPDTKITLIVKV